MDRGKEFLRLASALDDILDRRMGPSPDGTGDGIFVAIAGKVNAQELLGAMKPDKEREKLRRVLRLARELGRAWEDLHLDVKVEMATENERLNGNDLDLFITHPDGKVSLDLFKVLDALPELVSRVDRAAHGLIKAAPVAGRTDLQSVAVIDKLREIWLARKGVSAPKNINDSGPFTDLVREVFEALEARAKPRSAVDSWRKFSLKTKIRDWLGIQS